LDGTANRRTTRNVRDVPRPEQFRKKVTVSLGASAPEGEEKILQKQFETDQLTFIGKECIMCKAPISSLAADKRIENCLACKDDIPQNLTIRPPDRH